AAHPGSGRQAIRKAAVSDAGDTTVWWALKRLVEQFRGLHERHLIRYRLKPGDIQGVDLA
ncbi:MAG: hypothetical protein RI542_08435, partial [Wenzhouxiangella sp.]|nr:hypothetical protein [Wenzhouxiangella sp.]